MGVEKEREANNTWILSCFWQGRGSRHPSKQLVDGVGVRLGWESWGAEKNTLSNSCCWRGWSSRRSREQTVSAIGRNTDCVADLNVVWIIDVGIGLLQRCQGDLTNLSNECDVFS